MSEMSYKPLSLVVEVTDWLETPFSTFETDDIMRDMGGGPEKQTKLY